MMNKNEQDLIKSILGDDILESLEKSAIIKLNTQTGVDPEEIKVALQIVPRSILSFLFYNLKDKKEGDVVDLELPFAQATIHLNKLGPDNYNGEIVKEGKRLVDFANRSLPSIGLLILSTFELYDMSLLDEIKNNPVEDVSKINELQSIIDQRFMLEDLVSKVVDRKIDQKEAINRLIKERLYNHMLIANHSESREEIMEESKKSRLKQFLENREKKKQESLELDKNEIMCPDCNSSIYKGEKHVNLCICYGSFHNKKIKIVKSEDGKIRLNFPKNFDIENIEMLLSALKGEGL